MNRRIARIAFVVLAFSLALVPAAVAGKGKGSGQGNLAADPTLSASCNPCALGTYAHFSGSGYDPSQPQALVYFRGSDGSLSGTQAEVNADGTLAFDIYMAPAGTYDILITQDLHNKTVLQSQLNGFVVQ